MISAVMTWHGGRAAEKSGGGVRGAVCGGVLMMLCAVEGCTSALTRRSKI